MKKTLFALLLALLIPFLGRGQCAATFGTGQFAFTEVCNITGAASYAIVATTVNDSTFTLTGLWEEPGLVATCHVNCSTMALTIDSVPVPAVSGFVLTGSGSLGTNSVNITYTIYNETTSAVVDFCSGIYPLASVGVQKPAAKMLLWPNPASQSIHVQIHDGEGALAQVYDFGGKLVATHILDGDESDIALDGYSPGLYLLHVATTGGQAIVERFFKD
jgi:hypothetical protein